MHLKKQSLYIPRNGEYIKALEIDFPVGLAPMAGVSDKNFRSICYEFGLGFSCTELVSVKGIAYKGLSSAWPYLALASNENLPAIQLFGSEPEFFAKAISLICAEPRLAGVKMIDINMGCPVPKVCKTGAGSHLMLTPYIAQDIVRTCNDTLALLQKNIPVTVKFRKGYEKDQVLCVDFALAMAEARASMISIHGRTREQMYNGKADWQVIGEAKAALNKYSLLNNRPSVVLIANGDVCDAESAREILQVSQADGMQIGRAASTNPWIFADLRQEFAINAEAYSQFAGKKGLRERLSLAKKHFKLSLLEIEDEDNIIDTNNNLSQKKRNLVHIFRKILLNYLKDIPHSASLRKQALSLNTPDEFFQFCEQGLY